MKGWQFYGTRSLQVCPYMPNTPVYRDGVLNYLYEQTKAEGKIDSVFCGDDFNGDQFVSFFERRKTLQVLCAVENDKTLKPRGYSWVDNAKGVDGARSAMCGFCFFGSSSKDSTARDLGMLGLAYWFQDLKIDVIHGISLESNIPARNYAAKLGFRECATVPEYHFYRGELVGARVMVIRSQEFMPKFEEWMAKQEPSVS